MKKLILAGALIISTMAGTMTSLAAQTYTCPYNHDQCYDSNRCQELCNNGSTSQNRSGHHGNGRRGGHGCSR